MDGRNVRKSQCPRMVEFFARLILKTSRTLRWMKRIWWIWRLVQYSVLKLESFAENLPESIAEARASTEWLHWEKAVNEEKKAIRSNNTWEFVPKTENMETITTETYMCVNDWRSQSRSDGCFMSGVLAGNRMESTITPMCVNFW